MRIYIAGPYSSDPEGNTKRAEIIACELAAVGHAPHVPHWTGGLLKHAPGMEYETFMRIDFEWLRAAEAVVRFTGHSPGADREVELARKLGIPVYHYPWDMHKLEVANGKTEPEVNHNADKPGRQKVGRVIRATCGS